jgi:hypothetical protein
MVRNLTGQENGPALDNPASMQAAGPCLRVLTASEQKVLGGEWVSGTKLSGLPTIRAVVNAVIKQAYDLDDTDLVFERDAPLYCNHWQHYHGRGSDRICLGEPYPVHALVSGDGIDTTNDIADYMNKVFDADRARYPKHRGWTAIAAHSRSPLPLDRNHPFFRYRDTLRIDGTCCRFLVVDSMAVEGMNNRFLAIWGAAEVLGSVREAIQRLGRPLRSAAVWDGQRVLVPPASHDRVYVFTHEALVSKPNALGEACNTAETIAAAIDFLTDMYGATQEVMSIDEYVALEVASASGCEVNRDGQLSRWGRCAIVQAIGEMLLGPHLPDLASIVTRFGGAKKLQRQFVKAYAESLIAGTPTTCTQIKQGDVVMAEVNAIEDIKNRLLRITPPDPTEVLEEERLAIAPLDGPAAKAWLSMSAWGTFFRQKWEREDDPEWLDWINAMYRSIEGRFDKFEFDIRQPPAARLANISDEINRQLANDAATAQRVRELVLTGTLHHFQRLHLAEWADFEAGGKYCKPSVTFALRNEQFVSQLEAWVCFVLLKEGRLSKVGAALRFERFWEREQQVDRPST